MIQKRRHLKNWVLPTLLGIMFICIISISAIVSNYFFTSFSGDNYTYVLRNILSDTIPVNSEITDTNTTLIKPFDLETVSVHIGFYESDADSKEQEKSLILYDKTYMPNSGILYGSEEQFEILAMYEGEVISVTKDDVFGYIVEIKHTNNLISKYSSMSKVEVNKGDTVNTGEIIGTSGSNKLVSVSQNMLLFELMYNGTNVNPEKYYDKNINELE